MLHILKNRGKTDYVIRLPRHRSFEDRVFRSKKAAISHAIGLSEKFSGLYSFVEVWRRIHAADYQSYMETIKTKIATIRSGISFSPKNDHR